MKVFLNLLILAGFGWTVLAGGAEWETDFEKAKALSQKEGRIILLNFSGSDWCGWCKRLEKEVFSKAEFSSFADKELVLVKVDFPRFKEMDQAQTRANRGLADKYGVSGFPTILLVDANEKVLMRTGYMPGGPKAYVDHLKNQLKL